jgi:peptidoglycan/xylan/chitin deacetylase (PgdA/CDA1 family)
MKLPGIKRAVARAADAILLTRLGHRLQAVALSPFVRAVNYHGIAKADAATFERHLEYYARHFHVVDDAQLLAFHDGRWAPAGKPALIISFDDGVRSQYDIAARLLDEYGLPGWFFIAPGLVDTAVADQRAAAERQGVLTGPEGSGERIFMSWHEIRSLRPRHVIGCHTYSHHRLSADTPTAAMEYEIVEARHRLEAGLGEPVDVFCWVGGEEHSYSAAAAELIRRAGYRMSFMTNHAPIRRSTSLLHLQRSNVEGGDPLWLTRFQLSGALDIMYIGKRRRVNRLTGAAEGADVAWSSAASARDAGPVEST